MTSSKCMRRPHQTIAGLTSVNLGDGCLKGPDFPRNPLDYWATAIFPDNPPVIKFGQRHRRS